MKLGSNIGEGGNSEVFEWGNKGKVVKLAKPNINNSSLRREYKNNLTVYEKGLSAPQPFEIIEINKRLGIVFERIHGETLKDRLFRNLIEQNNIDTPSIDFKDVQLTARLLSKVHQFSGDTLPPQREYFKNQIESIKYLNKNEKESVIKILDGLPIKSRICHGDPNPNNILVRNGNLVLIDWMDATNGNPEADLAEYIIMIRFSVLPSNTPPRVANLFDSLRERIEKVFMDEYTRHTGTTYDEVDLWIAPIAARKLYADAINHEEKQLLLKEIRSRIGNI